MKHSLSKYEKVQNGILKERSKRRLEEGIYVGRKQFAYAIMCICNPLEPKKFKIEHKHISKIQDLLEKEL